MVAVTAPGDPDPKDAPPRWPQFLAAALATLCASSSGSVLGWSSPSLPVMQRQQLQLVRDNTSVNVTLLPAILTDDQASWAGSLVPLGALLGSVPAGFLADALGRKPVMLGVGAHFLLGWLLILAATLRRGVWLLFCGRALQGACCGAITVVAPLYLEEIAEAQVRGCTGVLFDLATNAGVLSAYVLGAVLAPPALAGALAALPALFLLAFAWMPESPVHLAAHGRDARARRALTWLRAGSDVTEELADMKELLRTSGRLRAQSTSSSAAADPEAGEGAGAAPARLAAAQGDAAKVEGARPCKRVSLPALLTLPPASRAPGRRYSVNLCAAQNDAVLRKEQEAAGHENAAFEDTEGRGRRRRRRAARVGARPALGHAGLALALRRLLPHGHPPGHGHQRHHLLHRQHLQPGRHLALAQHGHRAHRRAAGAVQPAGQPSGGPRGAARAAAGLVGRHRHVLRAAGGVQLGGGRAALAARAGRGRLHRVLLPGAGPAAVAAHVGAAAAAPSPLGRGRRRRRRVDRRLRRHQVLHHGAERPGAPRALLGLLRVRRRGRRVHRVLRARNARQDAPGAAVLRTFAPASREATTAKLVLQLFTFLRKASRLRKHDHNLRFSTNIILYSATCVR